MSQTELLEKVKNDAANEAYQLPYAFLTHSQKADLIEIVACDFARELINNLKTKLNA
jgi:hypothetical protein